ncbi:MAG: HAD-IIIC family phosphatase [Muribaculaceae bacterium]|nr:HAD-IIIC family phosphatase [Muribaculaceae bacterium]
MTTFVFRNQTIEAFLGYKDMTYSGYDDISQVPSDVDRYIWFYQVPVNADSAQLADEISSYRDKLDMVLAGAGGLKPFIILSLVNLFPLRLTGNESAVEEAIASFNSHAVALSRQHANVKWVDFDEFTSRYSSDLLVNWKYYFMSQTLLNPKLAHDFQAWWQQVEAGLRLQRKKCLVLDLDNTLWGGVLGEDGIDGIQLGGEYPGKAYTYWQRSLLQLARNGVILAVCSKNNEQDVQDVWLNNPHMVLKGEHFSAKRINWQDKATNIADLASELNIGMDSMVFLDDNPAERELIRQFLPLVEVPDFPEKPYQLMAFYRQLVEKYFRVYAVTDEDRAKTEQYRANAMRNAEQSRFADMESYLYSLDIAIDVIQADEHNLPRIAQMTQKTNQFNLTTRRYTIDDVSQHLDMGWRVYCMSVSDRFGDSGITGTVFLEPVDDVTVNIDTLLLSCRILGKGIEEAFIKTVFNLLRLDGYRAVRADYLPTPKNGQTADFYDRMGMTLEVAGEDGSKHYTMALDGVFEIKNCYNIRVL